MAPRKKSAGGSKKSHQNQQQSQPSKFGIQHFFERHTQNSQNPKSKPPTLKNPDTSPSTSKDPQNVSNSEATDSKKGIFTLQNPVNESTLVPMQRSPKSLAESELSVGSGGLNNVDNSHSQNTPTGDLLPVVGNVEVNELDVSPEIRKGASTKRFKFSPGMVIFILHSDCVAM